MKSKIKELEEELRIAMLNSDVTVLDKLIDDSLVFTGPDGTVATKEMDLNAHKSRIQKMTQLIASEQTIDLKEDLAIVTVKMDTIGNFAEFDITGKYRYLRIWQKQNENWKIIAGSVVKIPE